MSETELRPPTLRRLGQKEKAHQKVHVYVATPSYNGRVDYEYSQSMVDAAFACPLFGVNLTSAIMRGGAFIDLGRNLFVHWFLNNLNLQDCTHLFFVDSDLRFEPRAFIGLAKSGQPICAGAYRRRQEIEDYPVLRSEHANGGLWVETDENGGEWIMADRAPTGFMCISREVLTEMAAEARKVHIDGQGEVAWLFHTYINEKGQFVGEDFAFCDDYRKKYGKPIPVWPDLDFMHGGYKGNFKAWLVKKIAESEGKKPEDPESMAIEIPTSDAA